MQKQIISVLVILFLNHCYGYQTCPTIVSKIEGFEVEGCSDTDDICQFPINTDVDIKIKFTPRIDVKKLTFRAFANTEGKIIDLSSSDACENSGLTCPLDGGQTVTFDTKLHINDSYPKNEFYLELSIEEEKQDPIICIAFWAKVKK